MEAARNGWDGAAPDQKSSAVPRWVAVCWGCRLPFGNHTARRPVCQPFVCGAEPVFRHPVPVRVVCRSCVLLCPVVGYARRACTIHPPQAGGQKNIASEFQRYRACGIILLLMNQALAGIVVYMVTQNRGFSYPGFFDLWDGAVYVLYHHFSDCQRDQIPEAYGSPVMFGDQGRQSDGCAGFHAFAGNRHARSVWERRTGVPPHNGCRSGRSRLRHRAGNGDLYDRPIHQAAEEAGG